MSFTLYPKKIYQASSKISGKIVVREWLGEKSLVVQGVIQSGGMVKGIWRKALKYAIRDTQYVIRKTQNVKNCLVLGLGGGTVIQLIKAAWPKAKITAVELDPEIIKISKQFFSLDKLIENDSLKIINTDALEIITYHLSPITYQLIIVDLYLGGQFPKEAESQQFLKSLKKILAKDGIVIFNRLRTDKCKNFEDNLKEQFKKIKQIKTPANQFFIASNKN